MLSKFPFADQLFNARRAAFPAPRIDVSIWTVSLLFLERQPFASGGQLVGWLRLSRSCLAARFTSPHLTSTFLEFVVARPKLPFFGRSPDGLSSHAFSDPSLTTASSLLSSGSCDRKRGCWILSQMRIKGDCAVNEIANRNTISISGLHFRV
jgi:hypothetical protein